MEGFSKYQTVVPHNADKDYQPVGVLARKLESTERIVCPQTQIMSTGSPGDYVVKLPDAVRKMPIKDKAGDGAKPIEQTIHGRMFVVSGTVFARSYEPAAAKAEPKAEPKAEAKVDDKASAKDAKSGKGPK
jgi:hypothetical protein